MKKVNNDADAVIVTAKDPEDNMVVMSQRDYDSMQETIRITSNKYVMDKIHRGEKQFDGHEIVHDLIEVSEDD
jgi:antitoxin YefM